MPQLYRFGSYVIYFWANENTPLEPIHVHITEGRPQENGTKIWITQTGRCLVANNRSKIPDTVLRFLLKAIEANSDEIKEKWVEMFDEIHYFC